ncbi:hypothetical protein [Indioceanicola profundi]|uniref:hypothetical protein n=1 Tax=Indioceanicola profundi TaxID=2220096 RepID=UPI000E6A9DF1|nr:hypothetical protein [Indioceanicola profundi]
MRRAAVTLILPAALLSALLLTAPVAQAAPADAVLACTGVADAAERLACFDRTVPALRGAAPSVQAARPPAAPTPPAVAAAPAERFGAEQLPQARAEAESAEVAAKGFGAEQLARTRGSGEGEEPEELTAKVAKLGTVPDQPSRLLITLDNGQVWAQRESKQFQLKAGDTVVIKPAILGSYKLTRAGSKLILKVRRVQ